MNNCFSCSVHHMKELLVFSVKGEILHEINGNTGCGHLFASPPKDGMSLEKTNFLQQRVVPDKHQQLFSRSEDKNKRD